jgi:hypothetical protein
VPLLSRLNDTEAAIRLAAATVTVGLFVYPEPPEMMIDPDTEPPKIVAVAVAATPAGGEGFFAGGGDGVTTAGAAITI